MKANPFRQKIVLCGLVSAIVSSSCATTGKSVTTGAAVGGGLGVAMGAIADPGQNGRYRTRNVIIGGALGAVTGMLAGAVIHSANNQDREKEKSEAFKAGQSAAVPIDPNEQPKLIPAQWRAEVVDAKRLGNRFIPRHVEYVITDPARWEDLQ